MALKATVIKTGKLQPLNNCYILIPGSGGNIAITLDNLPDISDSKGAVYPEEPIIGRATPLETYSHSESRVISIVLHFIITDGDFQTYIDYLRLIQSAVYPQNATSNGAPFSPPPICQIKCGKLLADNPLCCILLNYNVSFPTDVQWDEATYLPSKFDVTTSWRVVYASSNLPTQERIFTIGS